MSLRFEQPEWLLLLVLAVPVAVVGVRWLVAMSAVRRWSAVVARVVLIALIAGMLSGATAVRRTQRLAVIALVDVSGSVQRFADLGRTSDGRPRRVTEAVREFLRHATAQRGPDDLLGIVVFDGSAAVVAPPTRVDVLDRPLDLRLEEGTDLAGAIRLAAALFPPDAARRMIIFSDGNETEGNALEAALELAGPGAVARRSGSGVVVSTVEDQPRGGGAPGGGVVIDVAPISFNLGREVIVESVDAPPQAPAEAAVTVRVVLESTAEASGTLLLTREGEPIDANGDEPGFGRRLTLRPGRTVETVQVRLPPGRVHRFDAVFEPDPVRLVDGTEGYAGDTVLANNRGQTFTLTPGNGSILIVDGVSDGDPNGAGATLAAALRSAGLQVQTVPPQGLPADLLSLQTYDLVVLQSVAAEEIPRESHELLASYVSKLGGGLVMVGGPGSFGAGGWKGTALEPILPVRLDLPERLVMPAAAILLVLDNSGSMGTTVMGSSRTQQEIANEGAALAVQTLDRNDLVGVITFNSWHRTLVPLSPNTDPARTSAAIRAIGSDGGTNIPPALEEAYRVLRDARATVKHVVLLTDGVSMDKEALPAIAARMHAEGISLSTIAVGDGADTAMLAVLAERGGGTYYRVTDPNMLPRIFVKAVRVVRTPMIRQAPFQPRVVGVGSPVVEGLGRVPILRGLVLTQPRGEPTVTMAMEAEPGEPLLAYWNAGLGRVAAFTSDAHAEWAEEWMGWPGYTRLWTQLVRQIARPQADRRAELTTELVGDELRIRLEAIDDEGRPQDLLTVPGTVYAPDGSSREVQLVQTGPGTYEGSAPAPGSGNYVVLLTPRLGERPLAPVLGGASRATGLEYRRLRSNITLLRKIASATGGTWHDIVADARPGKVNLFDRSNVPPMEARVPLWRTLLAWAVVVMLLDVGTRRIAWDRLIGRRFGQGLRKHAAEAVRDRTAQAARTLASLRERGKREEQEPAPGAAVLSAADAKRIVQEQAERRRAERAAARRAAAAAAPAKPAAAPPEVKAEAEPKVEGEEGAPTSGLLAAKRRARERYEQG